jgi:hypothetical protein
MKTKSIKLMILIPIIFLGLINGTFAQNTQSKNKKEKAINLLDGKDLKNWVFIERP